MLAYADDGYFWVPGTGCGRPRWVCFGRRVIGAGHGIYVWNAGYWGPRIGYYGGIDYGYGYVGSAMPAATGTAAYSAKQDREQFRRVTINNTYNKTRRQQQRDAGQLNGGTGGTRRNRRRRARPRPSFIRHRPLRRRSIRPRPARTRRCSPQSTTAARRCSHVQGRPVHGARRRGREGRHGTVPAGRNAAGAAAKGTTGTANTLSAKQATGTPNAARSTLSNTGGAPKATNVAGPKKGSTAAARMARAPPSRRLIRRRAPPIDAARRPVGLSPAIGVNSWPETSPRSAGIRWSPQGQPRRSIVRSEAQAQQNKSR